MDPKELVGLISAGAESNDVRLFVLKDNWRVRLRHMPRNRWRKIVEDNTVIEFNHGKREERLDNDGVRAALIRNSVIDWSGLTPDILRKMVYLPDEMLARIAVEGEIKFDPDVAAILLREGMIDDVNIGALFMELVLKPEHFSNGLLEGQVKNSSDAPDTTSIPTE